MIDLTVEEVISLNDAAKKLPCRRQGKKPHIATLYRWAMRGCRGVKLETLRVGGTLCTSLEALQRFCEGCTGPSGTPANSSKAREREILKAERELTEAGI